eukprot:TRINITY_DN10188_c0_g1_i3.p1 TRINITY_DN10188_c0_g1~~TRINITY_DN10188_c0_g1_i3.p1  ORF type:complete len:135 (-),score=0.69 TRINITY_DN10188_c0_g1_i3:4-408(-)
MLTRSLVYTLRPYLSSSLTTNSCTNFTPRVLTLFFSNGCINSITIFFFLMIRRPPRSTLSSSSAASDVYKRQPLCSVSLCNPLVSGVVQRSEGFEQEKSRTQKQQHNGILTLVLGGAASLERCQRCEILRINGE